MINKLLITRTIIKKYVQFSNSSYDDKMNEIILQAQITDLMPLLGERLYFDLLENTANHTELLEGGIYEYNGITYTNVGLECVLSYYFYARYCMFGDVISNPFGQSNKLNVNESKPIEYPVKKAMFQANQQTAYTYWESVRNYLERNSYPLYMDDCIKNNKVGSFRISKV